MELLPRPQGEERESKESEWDLHCGLLTATRLGHWVRSPSKQGSRCPTPSMNLYP